VGTSRFELLSYRLGGDRSIQLSYVPGFGAVEISDTIIAFEAFAAYIAAELHAIEPDSGNGSIGAVNALLQG
jgi:hypothetical protein